MRLTPFSRRGSAAGLLLAKPFEIDDLLGVIRLALDGTMSGSNG
jgi:hypothetical protein